MGMSHQSLKTAFKTIPMCLLFTFSACDPISNVHSCISVLSYCLFNLSLLLLEEVIWFNSTIAVFQSSVLLGKTVPLACRYGCSFSKLLIFGHLIVPVYLILESYSSCESLSFCHLGPIHYLGFQVGNWKRLSLFLVCSSQW